MIFYNVGLVLFLRLFCFFWLQAPTLSFAQTISLYVPSLGIIPVSVVWLLSFLDSN